MKSKSSLDTSTLITSIKKIVDITEDMNQTYEQTDLRTLATSLSREYDHLSNTSLEVTNNLSNSELSKKVRGCILDLGSDCLHLIKCISNIRGGASDYRSSSLFTVKNAIECVIKQINVVLSILDEDEAKQTYVEPSVFKKASVATYRILNQLEREEAVVKARGEDVSLNFIDVSREFKNSYTSMKCLVTCICAQDDQKKATAQWVLDSALKISTFIEIFMVQHKSHKKVTYQNAENWLINLSECFSALDVDKDTLHHFKGKLIASVKNVTTNLKTLHDLIEEMLVTDDIVDMSVNSTDSASTYFSSTSVSVSSEDSSVSI